jgi:demethylphylloquinol methyltransferase
VTSTPTPNQVQDLFNRIAPVYDALNDWLSLGQHRIWKAMAIKWSQAQAGDTCLDLCCGSGDLALMLARRVGAQGHVHGVDFSAAQLAIAARRSQHCTNLSWIEADALSIPFADQTFDALTMGYGLRNVGDIPACLREIHRVLKPGATAAILDLNHPEQAWMADFQNWYLQTLVVPLASRFNLQAEYNYLAPSLERFPRREQQIQLALEAGFETAVHYAIAGGTMGVLVISRA